MSLQQDLHDALAEPIGELIADLGEEGKLRRRVQTRAADGSRTSTLDNVQDASNPLRLLPVTRSATVRANDWGRDVTVDLEAYILDSEPAKELDVVKVTTGIYAGKYFEAVQSRPEPAGAVVLWAFRDAGDLDALDVGF